MIKHIVAFRFKDTNKADNIQRLKSMLDSLKVFIPEILSYETGLNISDRPTAYDLVLVSGFASVTDLETYRNHPEHLKVADFIKQVVSDTVVVDYEI